MHEETASAQQDEGAAGSTAAGFAALAARLSEGVVILGARGEVEYSNESARKLLAAADPTGFVASWERVRAPLDVAIARAAPGESAAVEIPASPFGHRRCVRLEAHPLPGPGTGRLVLMRDQDALRALQHDLQLAAQSRGLANIYRVLLHDAKAPLNAIVLNLDMLRDSIATPPEDDPDVAERQLRYVATVRTEIGRVNRSLKAVLSRAGSAAGRTRRFDLRRALREVTTLVRPMAREQHVKVRLSLPPEPVRLFGPRDRLKQALINVVINALESMPRGGLLGMSLATDERDAVIEVSDTGKGIPPVLKDRVFDMHFTTKKHGSGIGLYVARAVVTAEEGEIRLDSKPGEGTRVRIRLPRPLTAKQEGP